MGTSGCYCGGLEAKHTRTLSRAPAGRLSVVGLPHRRGRRRRSTRHIRQIVVRKQREMFHHNEWLRSNDFGLSAMVISLQHRPFAGRPEAALRIHHSGSLKDFSTHLDAISTRIFSRKINALNASQVPGAWASRPRGLTPVSVTGFTGWPPRALRAGASPGILVVFCAAPPPRCRDEATAVR